MKSHKRAVRPVRSSVHPIQDGIMVLENFLIFFDFDCFDSIYFFAYSVEGKFMVLLKGRITF
jgi:hypothetical protein